MRKYLIILSTILIVFIFYLEKTNKQQNINNEEIKNKSEKITDLIKKDDILILKNTITIKNGFYCNWIVEEDFAYGIYSKKSFLPKLILKNTKLVVQWATEKKVMLPGLSNSIPNQDTVICAKTDKDQEIYIVLIKGQNIKIINKGKKIHYSGDVSIADSKDLKKIFIIK
jgi:hypothetical protein